MDPITTSGLETVQSSQALNSADGAQNQELDQMIQESATTVFSLVMQIIQGEVGKGQS